MNIASHQTNTSANRVAIVNTHTLLDPVFAERVIRTQFASQVALVREIAQYGANLVLRLYNTSFTETADAVGVGALARQATMMIDAAGLCIEHGAIPASFVHLRGLVETHIYLRWMLTKGVERWGLQYYVSTLRKSRAWSNRSIAGTSEASEYKAAFQVAYSQPYHAQPYEEAASKEQIAEINNLLATEYATLDAYFLAWQKKRRREYEPEWYRVGPDAPRSIAHMAIQLGLKIEYLNAYQYASQYIHGSDAHHHLQKLSDEPMAQLVAIRDLEHLRTSLSILIVNAVDVFSDLLTHYRPGELQQFHTQAQRWIQEGQATPRPIIESQSIDR